MNLSLPSLIITLHVFTVLLLMALPSPVAAFSSVKPPFSNSKTSSNSSINKKPSASPVKLQKQPEFQPGQVLLPSSPMDPVHFDTAAVANPVVLPPCDACDKWQMYYYGNNGFWANGSPCFLPTGSCGLAESEDGIHWTKVKGSLVGKDGAVFGPSENPKDWDSLHVGVGDVVRISPDELHMYYFGGNPDEVAGSLPNGFRMRIGKARSLDNGRTWERMGMVLDYDNKEGLFASWPRIMKPKDECKPWQMLYHSFDGSKWRVYGATSTDQGETWTRRGLLLDAGTHKDSFDANGIGTRAVVSPWRGGALMVYESVDPKGKHRLGAAFNTDPDGGDEWTKLQRILLKDEGGPVAEPGKPPMHGWTTLVIGTPYLVNMPDGSLRMYHCGKDSDHGLAIGLVESEDSEVTPGFWKPVVV